MKTIKVAHDPKTELYLINFSDVRSYSSTQFLINGKEVSNPMNSPVIVFKEIPSKIELVVTGKRTNGYIINDKIITDEEYNSELSRLTKKGRGWDDDKEEWIFDNVEDEVNYIRFTRSVKRNYTEETTSDLIEIEIIHLPVSEYPEITPFYLEGGSVFDTLCTYQSNSATMFRERCEHYGFTKASHDNEKGKVYWLSHNDNFRFAKLGSSYVVNDADKLKFREKSKGTYEEMIAIHEKNIELIDGIIKNFIAKTNQEELKGKTLGEMVTTLERINNRIHGLSVYANSRSAYRELITFTETELKRLRNLTLGNE